MGIEVHYKDTQNWLKWQNMYELTKMYYFDSWFWINGVKQLGKWDRESVIGKSST